MNRVLDITPLRSLIAVAETGGFHRAAGTLRMSQSTVSQHVRRLEKVIGSPVVEPAGRGCGSPQPDRRCSPRRGPSSRRTTSPCCG